MCHLTEKFQETRLVQDDYPSNVNKRKTKSMHMDTYVSNL